MSGSGLRVAVFGATGTLGSELLAVLAERRFPVRELLPVAGDDSLGREVELGDQVVPVLTGAPPLAGADLVFLCAPPGPSLDRAADALRARVPAIDCSGALAARPEVPLLVADLHQPPDQLVAPLVASPPGPALGCLRVLVPLERAFGLRRVVATTLESASRGGRGGIESLTAETIALFSQGDPPEPEVFGRPVAFDCVPAAGEADDDAGAAPAERALAAALRRVLGEHVGVAVTAVQVPTFCGDGISLALETERDAPPDAVADCLRKQPGLELGRPEDGPTTRAAAGSDRVLVGRVRRDPSREGALLLWLAADAVRLAALNAVRLAEARLRTH